jgi:thioredoxin-like negative regulator of GroEL
VRARAPRAHAHARRSPARTRARPPHASQASLPAPARAQCKTAAPIYARLSEEFSPSSCTFAKFNTDEAHDLATVLGISAMPTFKIFKGGKEVDAQRGFPGEAKLREMLLSHGAKLAKTE